MADDGEVRVRGTVCDHASGAPVANATIRLSTSSGKTLAQAHSDARGAFEIAAPSQVARQLRVAAAGYDENVVILHTGQSLVDHVQIALQPSGTFHEIGKVTTTQRDADRSFSNRLSAAQVSASGALRVADDLTTSPGLTVVGDGLAPGGDAYVSLRGLRASEGQALLDGHPIGPLGVSQSPPDTDGVIAGFNYQDAPYFALRSVNTTFGSIALPAFGVADIGGSVDLMTLSPTQATTTSLEQAIGNQERAFTALRATGTSGRLGYALAYAVSGTSGFFPGDTIAQTGLRGTDLTAMTLHNLTYAVSGDYVLRNELLKFVYKAFGNFSIAATAYGATSWVDKTGEGDNDLNPYAYTLANAPIGAQTACPLGVAVSTNGGAACIAAKTYAEAASGPAGGGPGASQAIRNQDYDVRLAGSAGVVRLSLDAFTDNYGLVYHRAGSAISAQDDFLDRWSTQGAALESSLSGKNNATSVKLSLLGQVLNGDATSISGLPTTFAATRRSIASAFLDDAYAVNSHLSLDASALLASAANATQLLPRFSATYRPSRDDVLRLSAGRTTEDPSLENARVNLLPVGAINPDCGAIERASPAAPATVNVGTGPASGLEAENATDLQLNYERALGAVGDLGLTLYDANMQDRIVSAQMLAGAQLPGSELAPLAARIAGFCGIVPSAGAVAYTIDRLFNAASARAQGVEVTGNIRVAPHVKLGYAYDVQTSVLSGISDSVLKTDPTLVNGAQAFEIPRNKTTIDLRYSSPALDVRLSGHAVGANNPQQLPPFAYADASVVGTVSAHTTLDLEIGNVFDSHAQKYGLVGLGVPYATNRYFSQLASGDVQPFNERYGLEPTTVTASVNVHL